MYRDGMAILWCSDKITVFAHNAMILESKSVACYNRLLTRVNQLDDGFLFGVVEGTGATRNYLGALTYT